MGFSKETHHFCDMHAFSDMHALCRITILFFEVLIKRLGPFLDSNFSTNTVPRTKKRFLF